jgi:hypothetical protein
MWNNSTLTFHVMYSITTNFDHVLELATDQNESQIHSKIFDLPSFKPYTHT